MNRIFGPNKGLVIGKLRKLHNERLRNRYSSSRTAKVINNQGRDGWDMQTAGKTKM